MKRSILALLGVTAVIVAGCGGSGGSNDPGPIPLTVPKASCGSGDKPETALQGQVPAALRAAGFTGFNCNLALVGQSKGDGANWQTTEFKDKAGHTCGYHGTSFSTVGRTQLGVRVIDLTDPTKPTSPMSLTTVSMLDPWESLKVNERRQTLAADNGHNGGGGPEIDIYDISGDCRSPQLLSSVAVGKADGTSGVVGTVVGHEGSWAPDGLTYYGGDLGTAGGQYYAVDTTDLTKPKLLARWTPGVSNVHGLSISDDGMRGYMVALGGPPFGQSPPVLRTAATANNGLLIYDLSDIQLRKPNPQAKLISQFLFIDGAGAQHTINVKIAGKPYIIFVDEVGPGGFGDNVGLQTACDAKLPVFSMARIIDISNEAAPVQTSRLMLETHDPANCAKVLPDLVGLSIFTYGSHYCSVDNRLNATTLACGYFNSGIRVFDIRTPDRPKEIAYYNPPGVTTASPGSNHSFGGAAGIGGGKPDWCSAQIHLNAATASLWTTCQDNGILALKFTNGVWPFPESSTPAGQQN
jgi:hypothetical protein